MRTVRYLNLCLEKPVGVKKKVFFIYNKCLQVVCKNVCTTAIKFIVSIMEIIAIYKKIFLFTFILVSIYSFIQKIHHLIRRS